MKMSRVNFGKCPPAIDSIAFDDLAHSFMASLLHNWQILHHYDLCWQNDEMYAYTLLPTSGPPKEEYFSAWSNQCLHKLSENGSQAPHWELLDDYSDDELTSWDADTSLILFTHFLDQHSPLMCLKSASPIALYSVPITSNDRDELYSWTGTYRDIDSLYMSSSGAIESLMYAQLADPASELSQTGRDLCKVIEKSTNIPTYYYLLTSIDKRREWKTKSEADTATTTKPGAEFKSETETDDKTADSSQTETENLSRCPACGASWIYESPTDCAQKHKGLFFYRCHQCRLIGNDI